MEMPLLNVDVAKLEQLMVAEEKNAKLAEAYGMSAERLMARWDEFKAERGTPQFMGTDTTTGATLWSDNFGLFLRARRSHMHRTKDGGWRPVHQDVELRPTEMQMPKPLHTTLAILFGNTVLPSCVTFKDALGSTYAQHINFVV
jgi:hypothetical protein